MSEIDIPDLHEEAQGWASLPPESRACLYPLLKKERRTGRDIARIMMFNAIAAFNGNRVLNEEVIRTLIESLTIAGTDIYNKYAAAFFVLSKAAELVGQFVENVEITCNLLNLHIENAIYENIDCPACEPKRYDVYAIENWEKYGNGNIYLNTNNSWHEAWKKGKEAIICCAIERLMFKTAGLTLKVPGLEAMINNSIERLKLITRTHSKLTAKAREKFRRLNFAQSVEWIILDWTQPLPDIDDMLVPAKVMREARRKLRLDTFAYDYNMLDNIFRPHFA